MGLNVGFFVGCKLEAEVGLKVGLLVGDEVGTAVGPFVGDDITGNEVGISDISNAGSSVGTGVRSKVGGEPRTRQSLLPPVQYCSEAQRQTPPPPIRTRPWLPISDRFQPGLCPLPHITLSL